MNSKTKKEVMKRRGSSSPLNIYQKMVLLIGILTLFLAIWVVSGMASVLLVGVIGAILVVFFALRYNRPKQVEVEKADPEVTLLQEKPKAADQQMNFLVAEERINNPQEILPPSEEKVIDLQGLSLKAEGKVVDLLGFPGDTPMVDLKEIFPESDEKVTELQEMLLDLGKKEISPRVLLEPKEKDGSISQVSRSQA